VGDRWVAFGLIFGITCTDLDAEEGCADRKGNIGSENIISMGSEDGRRLEASREVGLEKLCMTAKEQN
jgi:hypothetical protein